MVGERKEWEIEAQPRECTLKDYQGAQARWCPGCGDHSVLNAVQRMCRDKQLPPERTMVVSGIGCSSRFPHYMSTYGFHGLHGRAFPVACGIRSRRPDLHMFVVTGDGDCCAIGAGHWVHAIRYNMDLTVILLDNNVYGLTKNQTSPTTRVGQKSNTHPKGTPLPPLNPLTVALGITNASFVAQTIDWNPPHLYNTIRAAYEHKGTSFVRVLQRCPHFTSFVFAPVQEDMSQCLLMTHENGIPADAAISKLFPNKAAHDPTQLVEAQALAAREDVYPVGLFYRNPKAPRYDEITQRSMGMSQADKLAAMRHALERFTV
jgi:2-oxoglutarate/2-oxoacid ferredoxin oxidoreductase subunit beta